MLTYGGKQNFSHGSFPKVGEKQKTYRKKKERKKRGEKEVKTIASFASVHHCMWRMQATWNKKSVITMVSTCRLNQKIFVFQMNFILFIIGSSPYHGH